MSKILLIIFIFLQSFCYPQEQVEVQYSIVGMEFTTDYDVIKLRVPPWLKKDELILQITRAVIWPGEPPPAKKVYIHVFKETDQVGDTSESGAIYVPQQGFIWDLEEWKPASIPEQIPSKRDINIYNYLIESILNEGLTLDNMPIRVKVAQNFDITVTELDSIYSNVKYWLVKFPVEITE